MTANNVKKCYHCPGIHALYNTDIPMNSCNMILLECGHFEIPAISQKRLISFQVSFF